MGGGERVKFRKKPIVVEAIRYEGTNLFAVWDFMNRRVEPVASTMELPISTLEGTMLASSGDWIIKGVKGEFCPIKDDILSETYEPVVADEIESDGKGRT